MKYVSGTLTKSYRYLAGGAIMQSCSLSDQNSCTTDTYLSLPGGVTLTLAPTNPDTTKRAVYSLKNFHGDTAITASATGAPSSSVYLYEPYGRASASQTFNTNSDPSNASTGVLGWASNPTRKKETTFGLDIIQMGARVYLPGTGRFAQADPISGGSVNSYSYVVDPINTDDYSGLFCLQCASGASFLQPAAPVQRAQPAAPAQRAQPSVGYRAYNAPVRANITVTKVQVQAPAPRPAAPVMPTIAPLNGSNAMKFLTDGAAVDKARIATRHNDPGYVNIGGGFGFSIFGLPVGFNAGLKLSNSGVYPYITECAIATPRFGMSASVSSSAPTVGNSWEASGYLGVGGGYSLDGSYEVGVGTPGLCAGATQTWKL